MNKRKSWTVLERILIGGSLIIIIFCVVASLIIKNQISKVEIEISSVENQISVIEAQNKQIQLEIDERLTFEEIDDFAKVNNLVLNKKQIIKVDVGSE